MKTTHKIAGILFFIFYFLFSSSLKAQVDTSRRKEFCDGLMKCSYIFQGKIISSRYYTIKTDEEFKSYTSYLVEIDKVVKGNIKKGTVNILLPNILSSDGYIWVPSEALYCCYDDSPVKDSSTINSNSKSLEYYCAEAMSNGELKRDNNDNLIIYFPSIADFYAYIKANYGIDVSTK
jgi:hypothetical protein